MSSSHLYCRYEYQNKKCCGDEVVGYNAEAKSPFNRGSDQFCARHQIIEPWWPLCYKCKSSKVAHYYMGMTQRKCHECMKEVFARDEEDFSDGQPALAKKPVTSTLPVSRPSATVKSTWASKAKVKAKSAYNSSLELEDDLDIDELAKNVDEARGIVDRKKQLEHELNSLMKQAKQLDSRTRFIESKWAEMLREASSVKHKETILKQLCILEDSMLDEFAEKSPQ
jgi:hypothetical protein